MDLLTALVYLSLIGVAIIFLLKHTENNPPGNGSAASSARSTKLSNSDFEKFPDKFESLHDVQDGLRREGLEGCNLIIGIDYTGSNEFQGTRTFEGRSLHHLEKGVVNPYQEVITILGNTLSGFDEDQLIPAFGFGDLSTKVHM